MAIIKVVKKSGKTYTSLKKVLGYVGEKAYETYGINCSENYKKVAYEFLKQKIIFIRQTEDNTAIIFKVFRLLKSQKRKY